MRAYWNLTEAQRDDVDSDPAVAAALDAARDAARAVVLDDARGVALDEAYSAYALACDEAVARLFGKEKLADQRDALKQRIAAHTLANQELQRQLAEATHLLNYHRSTRTGEAAETNFALEEKLAAKEKDRQYHMDAINRLANFLGLAGTSHEVVQAAMDNMTRFAKELKRLHAEATPLHVETPKN